MKILLPIIAVLVLISGYFMLSKNSALNPQRQTPQVQSPSPTPQFKTFKSSSTMKFTIDVPNEAAVEEKFTNVIITLPQGKIYVGRNGTNFNNLDDYIKDLRVKNRVTATKEEKSKIDNNSALMDLIVSGENQETKEYFVYVNNWIYTFFSSEKSLYSTLDQIAQSFRYTP